MHNVGTVPEYKTYIVGTVPTYKTPKIGTKLSYVTLGTQIKLHLIQLNLNKLTQILIKKSKCVSVFECQKNYEGIRRRNATYIMNL